ncbi:MAG: hypothetical protein M3458_19140 [Acidobacteriota bacterium]|nr:hypothetical protein [Pseudomonadota bacterium]MDQ3652343.1 hypothetical protein [Acidobacteriota bacterium]
MTFEELRGRIKNPPDSRRIVIAKDAEGSLLNPLEKVSEGLDVALTIRLERICTIDETAP